MRPALLTILVLLATAVPAGAAELQPLVDLPPFESATNVTRLVEADHEVVGRASARGRAYRVDGQSVTVYLSPRYRDDRAARSYVEFLGTLPHGRELGRLRLAIRTPPEVQEMCGGEPGTLACYMIGSNLMVLPGQPVDPRYGVTVSSLMTHEYGHHIAMHRPNPPFTAIDWGPKYWASQELVCDHVLEDRLFPGNQGRKYLRNPGEAWADAYVRLRYPRARPWRYSKLLRPTRASLRAARRDVLDPWWEPARQTWTGVFDETTGDTWTTTFPLTLDGPITVRLDGPQDADFDVAVHSGGRRIRQSIATHADDVLRVRAACRERATDEVTLVVIRQVGAGPFTVTARYPG